MAEWLILVIRKVQQKVILVSKPLMVSYTKKCLLQNNLYSLLLISFMSTNIGVYVNVVETFMNVVEFGTERMKVRVKVLKGCGTFNEFTQDHIFLEKIWLHSYAGGYWKSTNHYI